MRIIFSKFLFGLLVSALLLIALEGVLLVIGVRPVTVRQDPFVGFTHSLPLFVERLHPDGSVLYQTAPYKLAFFNAQEFPRKKSANTFRIFCLGGSTTYGHPYDFRTSYCGLLHQFLTAADPTRVWEVVNAGGVSYASYRMAGLMEELVRYSPDLFIIEAGHNEFLERRTYSTFLKWPQFALRLGSWMSRTRLYAVISVFIQTWGGDRFSDMHRRRELSSEVDAILDHSIGPAQYHRDDSFHEQVLAQYQYSLDRMITFARSHDVQSLLVVPVSNMKDCSPFKSELDPHLRPPERQRWKKLYDQGLREKSAGHDLAALQVFEQALSMDSRYAELHYLKGQVLFDLKEFDAAEAAFEASRDLDICPLRSTPQMVKTVREMAHRLQVPLADFETILRQDSRKNFGHSILGKEYFLDHVHPTIRANGMLAGQILARLIERGMVHPSQAWTDDLKDTLVRKAESGLNPKSKADALRTLARVLNWAGKRDEAWRLAMEALVIEPDDVDCLCVLGSICMANGQSNQAMSYFRRAVEIRPRHAEARNKLGHLLFKQGHIGESISHFRIAVQNRPDYINAKINLADALLHQERLEEADEQYREVLRIRFRTPEAHNNRGILLTSQKRFHEAERHFLEALRIDPHMPEVHYNLAKVYTQEENRTKALHHLQEALNLNADFAPAHSHMGVILIHLGKIHEAIFHFSEALRIQPQDTGIRANLEQARVLLVDREHMTGR